MRRNHPVSIQSILKSSAAVAGAMLLVQPLAHANPLNGRVAIGSASVSNAGNSTTITQKSEGLVIDWSSFNIGSGQTTTFAQPNSQAIAVNEIGGKSATQIMGNLDSNGRVVIINGNGVLFGNSSQVNVGSLVATSSGGTTSNVLAGKFSKAGSSNAAVVNEGHITASQGGLVALVAPNVTNAGTINAKLGRVTLGGTNKFTVDFKGDGLVSFATKGPTSGQVTNTGDINGATVVIKASSAEGVAAGVVNVGGVITAEGAHERGGKIVLESADGTLNTTGTLNAAGEKGHGKIIEDADTVSIAGTVTAGQGGMWKVDPENLTVNNAAASTMDTALNSGTSVWEQTTSGAASGNGKQTTGNGDIVIDATLNWNTGAMLYLTSYHSIDFDAPMYVVNGGCLTFQTNDGGTGGTMNFGSNGFIDIETTGTSFTLNGVGYNVEHSVSSLISDMNSDPSGDYVLAQSYSATSAGSFGASPISATFTGTFYGLGNTISNLTINGTNNTNVGLFADIGAGGIVTGLGLTNVDIIGGKQSDAGALAGVSDGMVTDDYSTGTVSGNGKVGGLIGYVGSGGAVEVSYSTANVTGANHSDVGGLIGYDYTSAPVFNDYATGTVKSGIDSEVGGLIGQAFRTGVSEDFATGSVTGGNNSSVGGLIGYYEGLPSITKLVLNSYAMGSVVTGTDGLAGGLIGNLFDTSLSLAYSTGTVTAGSGGLVGGLIGSQTGGGFDSDVYWDMTTSGIGASDAVGNFANAEGATGLTTTQLESGLPTGFSSSIWLTSPSIDGGMPYLKKLPPA